MMKLRSRGNDVKAVQQRLVVWGAYITADGIFGAYTDAAVRAFQRMKYLSADGIVGPKTLKALATKPSNSKVTLHVGTLNVIALRLTASGKNGRIASVKKGKDYKDRVKGLGKVREEMGVSMLGTQEAGGSSHAGQLLDQMSSSWRYDITNDGRNDLSVVAYWNEKKRCLLKDGSFKTAHTDHNLAEWIIVKDRGTGVEFMFVVTHLYHVNSDKADGIRGKQATALITEAERIAKGRPIIYVGDFNAGTHEGKGDKVGAAFKKAKCSEADAVAKKKHNGSWATTNGLASKPRNGSRIDRIFFTKGVECTDVRTVFASPHTDHNGVSARVIVSKKR